MRSCNLLFILLLICLVGCHPSLKTPTYTSAPPTATFLSVSPTPTPIPPAPTITYIYGLSKISTGQYFFIAVNIDQSCAPECNCPEVEAVLPMYKYSPGELWIPARVWLDERKTLLDWPTRDPEQIIMGLYSYWNLATAKMDFIDVLPYKTIDGQFIIHAVDSQGILVVEGQGEILLLEPGQERVQRATADWGDGCRVAYTYKLFNHGLLTEEQIHTY